VIGYVYNKAMEEQLRDLGVREGDILLVHSSIKALGLKDLKIESLIKSIENVLGEKGTLLMPTLSYKSVDGNNNDTFSVKDTPSDVGVLSECFRKMDGVVRSLHPTHSVCAKGRFAKELLENHHLDQTPCGPNSPFRLVNEMGGHILFLGCGLNPNTSMHGVEELVEPDYLYGDMLQYKLFNVNREKSYKYYKTHGFKNTIQCYDRIEALLEEGTELKKGKVLEAECYLINAKAMWKKAMNRLREDEHYFVDVKKS
jgi:aminoglycoside 3-N-acetyltransferase